MPHGGGKGAGCAASDNLSDASTTANGVQQGSFFCDPLPCGPLEQRHKGIQSHLICFALPCFDLGADTKPAVTLSASTGLAVAKIPSEVPAFEHPTLGDSIRQALL